jgi:hypothetical protein
VQELAKLSLMRRSASLDGGDRNQNQEYSAAMRLAGRWFDWLGVRDDFRNWLIRAA